MRFLAIVKDALLAPLRMAMDPWKALHGQAGGMAQLTIAGTAGVITFILMAATAVAAFIAVLLIEKGLDIANWWKFYLAAVLLAIFTPIVVYYAVRFWTQEAGERFPDIENAWKQGLGELRRRGFELERTPLYVVLGSESSLKDQYLLTAAELSLEVSHFPRERGTPLRWYASEDAIFVVLTHVGCLTDLARSAATLITQERVQVPVQGPSNRVSAGVTCWPTEDESFIAADDSSIRPPVGKGGGGGNVVGYAATLNLDDSVAVFAPGTGDKSSGRKQPPKLAAPSRESIDLERRRLAFLCRLIRGSRYPICPINGVLMLLPLNLILADERDGALTQNAVQTDAAVMMKQFQMRFPLVVLSTGWDEDLGFQEFVRRMGTDKAHNFRFGSRFGVGDPPLKDQLGAMCVLACRAFEDWIYKLFREPNALSKPGNRALYGLLCKVRRYLHPRLDRIVAEGLGCDEPEEQDQLPLIAGCYFAAAGSHEDTRAFVVKSFQRLYQDTVEDLEWLPAAERANSFCYLLAYISLALAGLLVAAAVAALFWPSA
jgi:hypothetical protein